MIRIHVVGKLDCSSIALAEAIARECDSTTLLIVGNDTIATDATTIPDNVWCDSFDLTINRELYDIVLIKDLIHLAEIAQMRKGWYNPRKIDCSRSYRVKYVVPVVRNKLPNKFRLREFLLDNGS